MAFLLYDYRNGLGLNQIKIWISSLEKKERVKLDQKLDMLHMHGGDLFPNTLSATNEPGILKLRIHGNVQLRPLLCRGPVQIDKEFTLLLGAKEVGSVLRPKNAEQTAVLRKGEVTLDPANRRVRNERNPG